MKQVETLCEILQKILKAQKFIKTNLDVVKGYRRFFHDIKSELQKASRNNLKIEEAIEEFDSLFNQNMVKNFQKLQQLAGSVKDEYFTMMKNSFDTMNYLYTILLSNVKTATNELIENYPQELNTLNLSKLNALKSYCEQRVVNNLKLEFHVKCQNSGYTLSDVLNYIDLANSKETELTVIKASFIKEKPQASEPSSSASAQPQTKAPVKVTFKPTKKVMSVKEYRRLLAQKLQEVALKDEDEEIEIID